MKFIREAQSLVTVRHIEQGMIKVGNEEITENVILFRDSIQRAWQPGKLQELVEDDLATLIEQRPEIIIFGSGWKPCLPPRALVFALARRGIGFESMDTPAACRTFNILVSEDRDVAAALILDL